MFFNRFNTVKNIARWNTVARLESIQLFKSRRARAQNQAPKLETNRRAAITPVPVYEVTVGPLPSDLWQPRYGFPE